MSYIQGSWTRPSPPTVQIPLKPETSSKTVWESRVEGYVILRDLDLYLTKLAREFLLLASRVYMLQEWKKLLQLCDKHNWLANRKARLTRQAAKK